MAIAWSRSDCAEFCFFDQFLRAFAALTFGQFERRLRAVQIALGLSHRGLENGRIDLRDHLVRLSPLELKST